ncbi:MAG: hypothetical protein KF689_09745 [Gemmatimonadaceae bacterium]|nr:hypothetical protein [Gemmatimonadaceae bacterium]MCW5826118.1 hypothetical protein [Gemmatimonadaceae bacterium]
MLMVNPATCALKSDFVAALERLSSHHGVPVRILFFGVSMEDSIHARVRADLALDGSITSEVVDQSELARRLALPEGGIPTLYSLRRGELEAALYGDAAISERAFLNGRFGLLLDSNEVRR